jgi:enterochelin esterase family protein
LRRRVGLLFAALVWFASSIALLSPPANAQNLAGDEALSKVLLNSEGWQLVAEGFGFTDGACADADGNFYFMDLGKGTGISRVSPDGKVSEFLANTPKCSGLKFGPDGRLYACTQGPRKQVVALEVPSGKVSVLADNVQPNDLVVSRRGYVYFTETGKGQVTVIAPDGKMRTGATGINAPNGITLSPDQGTLVVSEYRGTNVWAYRVGADGGLDAGARYMELRTMPGRPDSGGDGSTTDKAGRYYVTSHLGIQMFDSTGRLGGVIAKPTTKGCVSVAFAGTNHEWLYACASDKIFRRKTQTSGALFFQKASP